MQRAQEFRVVCDLNAIWMRRLCVHLLGAAFLALLCGCSRPADEQALRERIAAMQQAVEQRDSGDFMAPIADNFTGPRGIDRDGLRRLVTLQFLRNQAIGATLGPVDIKIDGSRAQAEFRVILTGSDGGWIPQRADGYQVRTGWRIEEGRWMLETADW